MSVGKNSSQKFRWERSLSPGRYALPDALKRLLAFIKNLKTRGDCTEAIGQDLGVIGTEEPDADPATTKPLIKAILGTGGMVEIQWKKLGFTGVRIEVDRGNGQWVFLDIDTKPHYQDAASPHTRHDGPLEIPRHLPPWRSNLRSVE